MVWGLLFLNHIQEEQEVGFLLSSFLRQGTWHNSERLNQDELPQAKAFCFLFFCVFVFSQVYCICERKGYE